MPSRHIYFSNELYDLTKGEENLSGLINSILLTYYTNQKKPKSYEQKEVELASEIETLKSQLKNKEQDYNLISSKLEETKNKILLQELEDTQRYEKEKEHRKRMEPIIRKIREEFSELVQKRKLESGSDSYNSYYAKRIKELSESNDTPPKDLNSTYDNK